MDDKYYTVEEYSKLLNLSKGTIYRKPSKYYMFKVGGSWRANKESLKKFEQAQFNDNNIYRLALVGSKRKTKCQYTKEAASIGSMYPPQLARELDALLAPQTK
ncbi:hypothetical protein [Providencia rettgeri]|uniref:hypothetical protein n=1 Tax=Providencia rettgeri TaxID=587 RepID=UPI002551DB0B|nr:hypothetical protein [Providencia rettgeri]MDK7746559.1 hypothetical protein [Providencia rettgeri]MDK7759432.1 hypothetical protein [Providencia rettgeri]